MNKFLQVSFMAVALCSMVLLTSCNEDPPLPDNITEFQADAQGLGAADADLTVNFNLTREADADGNIVVALAPTGVAYGSDFTTEPAADANNKITIPVIAGATAASFKITKTNTTGLKGDEKVVFTIESVADGLVLGTKNTFTLSFSEIIASSAAMEVNGGGPTFPNTVFIDLSANRQTAVARASWDLGFSTKNDEFRVILNSANKMMARVINKTDLATVTAADTVGFGAQLSLGAIFGTIAVLGPTDPTPDWVVGSTAWVDDPKGDITKTAIASISANDAENKVYIVNPGTGSNWQKIRITRSGGNYSLVHADINSNNFTSVVITKNTGAHFQHVSFANHNVQGEPAVANWDIAWTGLTYTTSFGGPAFPYYFQDMIVQNTEGVSTAQVLITPTVTYNGFNESSLANITFVSDNQINIGPNWRSLGQTSSSLRTDRFYVIKDDAGNVYKLQFTALVTTAGERGKPSLKFDLIKKGA